MLESLPLKRRIRKHILELLNAIYALRLLVAIHEAAKRRLEFFATWSMSHAAQARTIPIDLARFRVERALLTRLVFELFWRPREYAAFALGAGSCACVGDRNVEGLRCCGSLGAFSGCY
jgi:hypothetical protein